MPRKTLTIIGILLIIIQISGVPHSWKTIFGILAGIYLVVIAIRGSKNADVSSELEVKKDGSISTGNNIKETAMSYDTKETGKVD